jgi:hypothetical protein
VPSAHRRYILVAMAGPKVDKRSTVSSSVDESYDRYKRLRWQPVLMLAAALGLVLALNPGLGRPDLLLFSVIPSSMLSLDQRVSKIMSLTPLIGLATIFSWSPYGPGGKESIFTD